MTPGSAGAPDRLPIRLAGADLAWVAAIAVLGSSTLTLLFPLPLAAAGALLATMLAWLSMIDLRIRLLPNVLTVPLGAIGLALSLTSLGPGLALSAAGAAAGYGVIALVAFAYRRSRGVDGIGLGDAKLLAALGAWLGIEQLPQIVLLAALAGLGAYAVGHRGQQLNLDHAIPFGPFLAAAGWVSFVAAHLGLSVTGAFAAWIRSMV